MALTLLEKTVIEKARSVGNSDLSVELSDSHCVYLCALIIRDLRLTKSFSELPTNFPEIYDGVTSESQRIEGVPFWPLAEKLFDKQKDAITYFLCLASLFKARLKYEMILKHQPFPTAEQIGPRGLLQFGTASAEALGTLISWRKWLYDLDNRAAQETGYLFEPIIAHSIGGIPVSAKKSPIKRHDDKTKARQVDCITRKRAYEIKMRVTIAASGQGRWGEELSFPLDCRTSGYTPVLIVFDSTENVKLAELKRAFESQRGEVFIGKDAWKHLEDAAGSTMGIFLKKYVHAPMKQILAALKNQDTSSISFEKGINAIVIKINQETIVIERKVAVESETGEEVLSDDIDEESPGL